MNDWQLWWAWYPVVTENGLRWLTWVLKTGESKTIYADWEGKQLFIDYTNYKGERSMRHVLPMKIHYGKNSFHPKRSLLLSGYDMKRRSYRTFALNKIHSISMGDSECP